MPLMLALLGAPSNIGIKPYDDGRARALDGAPATLRGVGIVNRLNARDAGDVVPGAYRDFKRIPGAVRNEVEVARYSHHLADKVATLVSGGSFPVVIGGDCSIVLGCLLGARQAGRRRVGLVYVDAHADFATPDESGTGSAASMCLALAVGRGASPLAALDPASPLVQDSDVVLIGRRDELDGQWYGHEALAASAILDLPFPLEAAPLRTIPAQILARVATAEHDGFWIHVDADVLSPTVMSAVDSPEAGGPDMAQLAALLIPLVSHPKALGIEVTIYDPALDAGLECAERLVALLGAVLVDGNDATLVARSAPSV